jgi:hypothetical protein
MSFCIRTLMISAGVPAIPPKKPEVEAIATNVMKEGGSFPVETNSFIFSYTPKRVVLYVSWRMIEAESCSLYQS